MTHRWRYRVASVTGTGLLVALAIAVVNDPAVQRAFATVPYFGRPAPRVLENGDVVWAISTAVVVTVAMMWPLFKPRPRRILDTILETQRRILLAMVGLAALGYFNYSYRLPRSTVMLGTLCMLVVMPAYMVLIRQRPRSTSGALLVGDDPAAMRASLATTDESILGYVSPSNLDLDLRTADGGQVERLGGLARIEDVLLSEDVDTVLLAFRGTDRGEFFGTLSACYDNGIAVKVHRDHAEHVLTNEVSGQPLLDVDLEPWDWQDYVVKRLFDVVFAGLALLVLSPVLALIALGIKLDNPGPVLYSQERTAAFGETFVVYKFRTMVPEAESETGATLSEEDAGGVDPRVTRFGRLLRATHLDEIPQLWSILVGRMSVVGPRPERPELDADIERVVGQWRRRWFVKPGLTGLAQIRGATGHNPQAKLRHDIEYIRRQSLLFDVKIIIRQLWQVVGDCRDVVKEAVTDRRRDRETAAGPPERNPERRPEENVTDGGRPRDTEE